MEEKSYPKDKILAAYKTLYEGKLGLLNLSESKAEAEINMKTQIAKKENLENKEGKPDIAKVKGAILLKSIETFTTGENKLALDIAILEQYLIYLKTKVIPKAMVDRYTMLANEEKDKKSEHTANLNSLKKGDLEEDLLAAVQSIVDEDIAKEKAKRAGKEIPEESKATKSFEILQKFNNVVKAIKGIIKT